MPTTAQIIVALATDAAIEDQLKKEIRKREEILNNLIGKKYIPQDNTYIREIVDGKKMHYRCGLIGVPCQIISRPYIAEVNPFIKDIKERMVKVKSLKTGFIYEVMFRESWIQ